MIDRFVELMGCSELRWSKQIWVAKVVGCCGGVVGCSFDYYFLIDLGKREKEKEKK